MEGESCHQLRRKGYRRNVLGTCAVEMGKSAFRFECVELELSIRLSTGNVRQAAGNTSLGFGKSLTGDTGIKMVLKPWD